MKFSNILVFVAGLAFTAGAVIPDVEGYTTTDIDLLSTLEEEENALEVSDQENVTETVEFSNDEAIAVQEEDSEEDSDVDTEAEANTEVEIETEAEAEATTIVATSTVVVEEPTTTETVELTETSLALEAGPVSCKYKTKDLTTAFDLATDARITCKKSSCEVTSSEAVTVSEGLVTITAPGTYIIEGELEGQLRVQVTEKDFVHLILNDVQIKSEEGPALAILSAEKVTVTLIGENTLEDAATYGVVAEANVDTDEDAEDKPKSPDATLYANSDISFNGEGLLQVTGNYGTAIHCTKDLKFVTGQIQVLEAKDKGVKVKNSICIKEADVFVNSINSALKVTRQNKADKGYIVIENGNITLSTENDAIHGETHVTIYDGFINILNCKEGIEAQMVDILGGEFHISATDDGINASKISKVKTGGIPPDPSVMPVEEPLPPEATDGSIYINIVGGKIYITVYGIDTDGIDSNGILFIGGNAELYIDLQYGKLYGSMATLDGDGANVIYRNATVVTAADELSWDDAEIFKKEKRERPPPPPVNLYERGQIYQPFIRVLEMPKQAQGTSIVLKDSEGQILASYIPPNSYCYILISTPDLVAGESYALTAGEFSQTIVAEPGDEGEFPCPSVESY